MHAADSVGNYFYHDILTAENSSFNLAKMRFRVDFEVDFCAKTILIATTAPTDYPAIFHVSSFSRRPLDYQLQIFFASRLVVSEPRTAEMRSYHPAEVW